MPLSKVTVCLRFQVTSVPYSGVVPLFSYAHPECYSEFVLAIQWNTSELVVECCDFGVSARVVLEPPLSLLEWESLCMVLDLDDLTYTLGHRHHLTSGEISVVGGSTRLRGGGVAVVGRQQHQHDGGLSYAFHGSLTHLALLGSKLTPQAIYNFLIDCSQVVASPLVSMNTMRGLDDWEKHDIIVGITGLYTGHFCQKQESFIMLPSTHPREELDEVCKNLGGSLVRPRSAEESENLRQRFSKYVDQCTNSYGSWLWVDAYRRYNNKDDWSIMWNMVPRKDRDQCLSVSVSGNSWVDTPCDERLCAVCHAVSRPVFTLRMSCTLPNDRLYTFTYDLDGHPILISVHGISIVWDSNRWVIIKGSTILAIQNEVSNLDILPLGVTKWHFLTEEPDCPRETQLLLSVCGLDYFACGDGLTCVPWVARCDLSVNCVDGSDEESCQIKPVSTTSLAHIPPPPPHSEKTLPITMTLLAITLKKIDFPGSRMVTEIFVELGWQDPRVTFYNLRSGDNSLDNTPGLWRLAVGGALASTNFTVVRSFTTVTRSQDPPRGSLLTQNVQYSGRDNRLQVRALYMADFSCKFHMQYFPFHIQHCDLLLSFQDLSPTEVKLIHTEGSGHTHQPHSLGFTNTGYQGVNVVTLQIFLFPRAALVTGQQILGQLAGQGGGSSNFGGRPFGGRPFGGRPNQGFSNNFGGRPNQGFGNNFGGGFGGRPNQGFGNNFGGGFGGRPNQGFGNNFGGGFGGRPNQGIGNNFGGGFGGRPNQGIGNNFGGGFGGRPNQGFGNNFGGGDGIFGNSEYTALPFCVLRR
ncbi:uncharacterized protein LOC121872796 [Homarus americanus]|uniref:uncharacterized protein LOC121872796 n=1 Tax=Homarus americanus TaxID=6706 RepID=UPI001C444C5C|nr:uncharacterized protein LOC121872796 [Homarus americanus]